MRNQPRTTVDYSAFSALLLGSILFMGLIGYGWTRMFEHAGVGAASILLGALLAFFALALASAAGGQKAKHGFTAMFCANFVVLLILSAFGAVNTMFLTFEGGQISKTTLEQARAAYASIKSDADRLMVPDAYLRKKADVEARWSSLKAEIKNPQLCGQGPEAAKRTAELQQVLPAFQPLAGGGCAKIPELIDAYEEQVHTLLSQTPEKISADSLEKKHDEIKNNANAGISEIDTLLAEAGTTVAQVARWQEALTSVTSHYNDTFVLLQAATNGGLTAPTGIDTATLSDLGNIGKVVNVVATRINEPSTLVYLAVAFGLDSIWVMLFVAVMKGAGDSRPHKPLPSSGVSWI